jgi:multicomponent Na+:H+ antiporter subunit E
VTRVPRVAAALAVVYALTLGSADPLDVATGAVLGAVLVALLRTRLQPTATADEPPLAERAIWLPVFAGAVLVDVIGGTWDVALRVLGVRGLDRPGIVRVPVGERTERGVAVSALATTLTPGSVLVDVDWERRDFLVHVVDASDPDEVRERLDRFYDRYQRRVFP